MDTLEAARVNIDAAERYARLMQALIDPDQHTHLTHAKRVSLFASAEAMHEAHADRARELLALL